MTSSLPQLRHLELGYNSLANLDSPADTKSTAASLAKLEELNLEGNNLADWNHIAGQLTRLTS